MKRLHRLLPAALLALPFAFVTPAAEAGPARVALPEIAPLGVEPVQYYGYRRGPRCWTEMRPVRFRDAYGRIFVRPRPVRFCR